MILSSSFKRVAAQIVGLVLGSSLLAHGVAPEFVQAATEVTSSFSTQDARQPLTPEERQERATLLKWMEEGRLQIWPTSGTENEGPAFIYFGGLNTPSYPFGIFKKKPYAEEILGRLILTSGGPLSFFENYEFIRDEPYARKLLELACREDILVEQAETNLSSLLLYFNLFKDFPVAEKILRLAAESEDHAGMLMAHFDDYKYMPNALVILQKAAAHDPCHFIDSSDLLAEKIPPEERDKFLAVVSQAARERVLNGDEETSLRLVRYMNLLHEKPDSQRFYFVKDFSAEALFNLICFGREELFTSSYNGLYALFQNQLKQEKKTLFNFVEKKTLPVFMEAAASYGEADKLLGTLPDALAQKRFVSCLLLSLKETLKINFHYATDSDRLTAMRMTIAVADMMVCLGKEGEGVRGIFEEELSDSLQKEKNPQIQGVLDLILRVYFRERVPLHPKLFLSYEKIIEKRFAQEETLKEESFFYGGMNIQRAVFYNDEDGKASFAHFKSSLLREKAWKIEDRKNILLASSRKVDGRQIVIVANKPESGEAGLADIENLLQEKNWKAQVLIHRGHSYHVPKTLSLMEPETKLVFLGSCGGYNTLAQVLHGSPNVAVIPTKGVGSMLINEQLLSCLNDALLNTNKLNWEIVWKETERRLAHDPQGRALFQKYIRPDLNVACYLLPRLDRLLMGPEQRTRRCSFIPTV